MTNKKLHVGHVLSVVPVSDIDASTQWFTSLFGTTPTNRPMESLSEWRVTDTGWVQVFHETERAGKAQLNLGVSDLDAATSELAARGLEPQTRWRPARVSSWRASPIRMAT